MRSSGSNSSGNLSAVVAPPSSIETRMASTVAHNVNTTQKIPFDTVITTQGTDLTLDTLNNRIIVASDGWYQFDVGIQTTNTPVGVNDTSNLRLDFFDNTNTPIDVKSMDFHEYTGSNTSEQIRHNGTITRFLAAGSYVEATFTSTGAVAPYNLSNNTLGTYFYATRVA